MFVNFGAESVINATCYTKEALIACAKNPFCPTAGYLDAMLFNGHCLLVGFFLLFIISSLMVQINSSETRKKLLAASSKKHKRTLKKQIFANTHVIHVLLFGSIILILPMSIVNAKLIEIANNLPNEINCYN